MRRGALLRAAVLAYLALLVLAALPSRLRPAFLDAPADRADRALGALSISPGLAIFSGSVTAVHRRATCLAISATRADGAVETLYANECPPTGFRWRIDPWDEMVLGLARRTRIERFVPGGAPPDLGEWWKLQALGDWFCHSPLASPSGRREVTLEIRSLLVLYSSGLHSEDRAVTCRWRCGEEPLATPRCERAPPPAPPPQSPGPARVSSPAAPSAGGARGWASRALERFFAPQPYAAMVVCRFAFGAIACGYFAGRIGLVQQIWGPEGFFGAAFLARMGVDLPARASEGGLDWLARNPSAALVWALWAAGAASSALFAVGAFTRPAGVIALAVFSLFHARNPYATAGWSVMLKPFLLYAVLAPSGRFGSVDAWRRGAGAALADPAAWRGPGWPVRLLQVHLCTMYLVAGGSRIDSPSWWHGEATFAAVSDLFYARFDADWHALRPLLAVATWAALAFEGLAPILLWVPRVGPLWALGLLALHAGLEIVDNHGSWQLLMGASLLCFLPARWVAQLLPFRAAAAEGDRDP